MHKHGAFVSEILLTHGHSINQRHLSKTVQCLREGKVIALPTDTGYCFAGHSGLKSTHATLLELRKEHPKQKPFSLLCKDAKQVSSIAQLSTSAYRVLNKLLPGPFTLILPAHRETPQTCMGSFKSTVGVRISNHPVAVGLMDHLDFPLLITSVTDAEELKKEGYLDDDYEESLDRWWTTAEGVQLHTPKGVHLLLRGEEPLPMKISTILDLTEEGQWAVLRDGGWPLSGLEHVHRK